MATGRLTKKQKEVLTDKITGLIKNSPALRMTTDSSVNDMNINQISGELNRIHYRAIGKDLPTEINIPVKQLGSGDPSPDNIRPIVGYVVDGIGTIYGGTIDLVSEVLTVTHGFVTLDGTEAWLKDNDINDVGGNPCFRSYIRKPDMLTPEGTINTRTYVGSIIASNMPTVKNGYVNQYSMTDIPIAITGYSGNTPNYLYLICNNNLSNITTVDEIKAWLGSNNVQVCYKLATPQTYQLTAQQMLQLLDQI